MAHGDYKCCAICDCKQGYVGMNEDFKDDICPACRQQSGVATVGQLLKKINSFSNNKELEKWIKEIGFSQCYYQNKVDDLVNYKLTGEIPEKWKSSVDWLKEIGALKK